MKISVIGTGYVGLVTGVCFASKDNKVICVDNDQKKLQKLQAGNSIIYEPGLDELLKQTVKEKKISFTDNLQQAIKESEIIFLCLPTPPKQDGSADLQYVLQVVEEIGRYMNEYKVIVNKSTVPVGTGILVKEKIEKNTPHQFAVVSNPEFLREGQAVKDFLNLERVVVGTNCNIARGKMSEVYLPFVGNQDQIIHMDIKSSELTKYAANSFLATKISFINEIAGLCEKVGADVEMIAKGIGTDSRIGKNFLNAGIGYGGSCFPKDVSALYKTGHQYNHRLEILDAVMKINDMQKTKFVEKVLTHFGNNLKDKKLAVWGLSFKPDTDDVREAPSLYILKDLAGYGAKISAYDPIASNNHKDYANLNVEYVNDKYEALTDADALIIITEWEEFKKADLDKVKQHLKSHIIFDGRNIYNPDKIKNHGFDYKSIGR